MSPDGQKIVMGLTDADGKARFWIRSLSSDAAQPMAETEGAIYPFWSPDSQNIGFFATDGKLRKIALNGGGHAEAIGTVPWTVYGGTWGREGKIVFSSGHLGLFQISASGGTAAKIPVPENGSASFRWPSFLPDGKHVLVTSTAASGGIFVVDLATGELQPVLPGENGPAQYVEPGYLLFSRGGVLMAQPFDLRSMRATGNPQSVAESVSTGTSGIGASISRLRETGCSCISPPSKPNSPGWIPRARSSRRSVNRDTCLNPYLSPDGRYAMVTVAGPGQKNQKLWLYDLDSGTASPFTFGEGDDLYPAWSPDSQQVAFASNRNGSQEDIYVKPVGGGSGERLLLGGEGNKEPDRWSADGRYILFDNNGQKTKATDVWALPLFGDRKPFPVVQSPGWTITAHSLPDGKWVAYNSDESGRGEIYVVPFPGPGGKWQISTGGGMSPFWPPGKELFYFTPDFRMVGSGIFNRGYKF